MFVRHGDLSFVDGNLVVLAGADYLIVHRGLLLRHAPLLADIIDTATLIETLPVLALPQPPHAITAFVRALYDGIAFLAYDQHGFPLVAALLRLLTAYHVSRIRTDILRVLASQWPASLADWEAREHADPPRPHPVDVIKLARDIDAPFLLPSAMYDLSRAPPSDAASGVFDPNTADYVRLDESDLLSVLRGREHAARYFSTFVVNELEGRAPSPWCLRRNDPNPIAKRACQIAFEAITFELLRDINGIISHRPSDPLYAMSDADAMQSRESLQDDSPPAMRTCDICRADFSAAVLAARHDFWRKLPLWFGVVVQKWG